MSKIIKKEDIEHIAKLAELEYSDAEIDKITSQLDKIIGYVAKISEADTSNTAPTSHVLKLSNVYREDKVKNSLSREDSLKNAPLEAGGGFKVPKID
ncbi:MAG: Asp-tRNA(Asn)/Glu-tRNA(Gln) amidotransferase subunit GatC [Actinobacteria bacterium]|nr:Asp-tRNA(Asn)/Glu-tRNA(Gln) amidotransferase subunit GatC [Actinomycetota bacterium]MCL6088525.1 Asp-tRNA(Asn)/Glu-tRNA(Gln) amidotransferase subunit GatC [Actinomycetota bacterium]